MSTRAGDQAPAVAVPHAPIAPPAGSGTEPVQRRRRRRRRAVRGRLGFAGALGVLALIFGLSAAIGLASPYSPLAVDTGARLLAPSLEHPFGTDALGRDIATRVFYGGRVAFGVTLGATAVSLLIGAGLGITAGYFGRWVDEVISRVFDIIMGFPSILLAIAVVLAVGRSIVGLTLAIGVVYLAEFGRVARGATLGIREAEYVLAARASGFRAHRVILRHCLPNLMTALIVVTTYVAARMLLAESVLSFLGVGVQPPDPSWGSMVHDGQRFLRSEPFVAALPGAILTITALALNFLGDGLRDMWDIDRD